MKKTEIQKYNRISAILIYETKSRSGRSSASPLREADLLAAALAIIFGLIGIDTLHAVEELAGVGLFDFGCARARIVATGLGDRVGGKGTALGLVGAEDVHKKGSLQQLVNRIELTRWTNN
jgi:hypothetical protein